MTTMLRNGATIIDTRDTDVSFLKVILCKWRGEFVTWIQNTQDVEQGFDGTVSGHYFNNLDDAVSDFKTRR